MSTLDTFTLAYIGCMLWSSTDNSDESGGEPLGGNYAIDDLTPEALATITEDCKNFQEANAEDLKDLDPEQCGHDFWLTRNHHGAGFWDRGLGELGQRLTKAAHAYGSQDPYVTEDGKVGL